MIKLILVLSFLSVAAFADDRELILEKHAISGYVPPEHRFVKDCTIYRNGNVEVVIKQESTGSGYTAQISSSKVWEIRQLLLVAKRFGIAQGAVICDAGTVTVTGHRNHKAIMIKSQKDCHSNRWRKGWAATRLRNIASNICGF